MKVQTKMKILLYQDINTDTNSKYKEVKYFTANVRQ